MNSTAPYREIDELSALRAEVKSLRRDNSLMAMTIEVLNIKQEELPPFSGSLCCRKCDYGAVSIVYRAARPAQPAKPATWWRSARPAIPARPEMVVKACGRCGATYFEKTRDQSSK